MASVIAQSLIIYGLAIVISMLTAVMIRGLVLAVAFTGARNRGNAASASAARPPASPVPTGPPAHHVAAITAAIAAMGGKQRIVHIEPARAGAAWISEGRLHQQISHTPR